MASTDSAAAESGESPQDDTYAAPYGRSCFNCSQAKCKCIYLKAGGKCQRCQRLDKECRQPATTRRSTTRRSAISKSAPKTNRLENKIEDLVSLLRAGVHPGNVSTTLLRQLAQLPDNQKSTDSNAASPPGHSEISVSSTGPSSVYTCRTNGAESTPEASLSDGGGSLSIGAAAEHETEPTGVQAEEYFTVFLTQMLPYFPCMYVPPGTTAQKLRRDRPFTWLCIMAIASKSSAQRRLLFDRIKQVVAQRLVHEYSCRELDMLQGILLYLGWSNQQVYNKANIYVFAQLAMGIVYEMGLFNPEAKGKHMLLCVHQEPLENCTAPRGQVMEERRAVLGCFLLTSTIATFLQQSDSLRWTPHLDDCLRLLEEQQECVNDGILVQQVRLQLVTDRLGLGRCYGGSAKFAESMQPSPSVYLRPMQTQLQSRLQEIMSRLGSHSKGYKIVLLHHYNTSLSLYESALPKGAIASTLNVTYEHLDYLYGCLDSTKSWFDVFLSIPPGEYIGFPFAVFAQMVQNLATLFQLSTLESPLWDTANVRRTADVLQILDTIVNNMSLVATINGLAGDPGADIFSNIAQTYHAVRVGWETRLKPDPIGSSAVDPVPSILNQTLPDILATSSDVLPGIGDHDWLTDMLNTMDENENG
ncbi:hypothetical protein AbraIFM66951_002745 [Aspergillus brasiliensis]|uniref:Zn(2)-C6 fungal-type domain-containing protein n=1 Tax=Aspergillus brasiliensis TaxID=319629 RepID=A0A9W6DRR7_9EURO|nr:hypothetical protein AbraCBS73388_002782 [Aspergillus brasiliensis]GKZ42812.1 hypothetical protein AbraIFM66951_002745 [Aspergillus brasiliensis]